MWSDRQKFLFLKAGNAAGWNEPMRYTAMRACGCPLMKAAGAEPVPGAQCPVPPGYRPSVKHAQNNNGHFEAVMALAEACAAQRGRLDAKFPRPAEHDSWREAAQHSATSRLIPKLREVWAEAMAKMPGRFFEPKGTGHRASGISFDPNAQCPVPSASLDALASRVCKNDPSAFPGLYDHGPELLDECDAGQLHRVLEALKAWVGREFYAAGITPHTFYIPAGAVAQVKAHAKRHQASGIGHQSEPVASVP